jgi:predicted NAD/FAD-binding protein
MKNVAIIGTGMAGMSAAYFLKDHFHFSLFEINNSYALSCSQSKL